MEKLGHLIKVILCIKTISEASRRNLRIKQSLVGKFFYEKYCPNKFS